MSRLAILSDDLALTDEQRAAIQRSAQEFGSALARAFTAYAQAVMTLNNWGRRVSAELADILEALAEPDRTMDIGGDSLMEMMMEDDDDDQAV